MFEALKGIKILDLTSVVVGPVATWRLSQYGAEVIKIEHPTGDLMRGLGGKSPSGQHSGTYLHLNRGKRNLCLDLKSPQANSITEKLIDWCDVVIANMRPDALERLGLGPKAIQSKHPEKIYCLISGYGTEGPYAGLPTYDSVLQGVSGIAGLSQLRDGKPAYVPMLICDHVVGEITSAAIMAAIIDRFKTGKGAFVEVPMFETMATFVLQEHLAQKSFEPPVGPVGDLRLLSPHNQPVKTKDGYISFTINTDPQVQAFLKATDRSELLKDPRFQSIASRAEFVSEWFEVRGAALMSRTTEEWLITLRAVDIPAMPCHTIDTLIKDPHLNQVNLMSSENHPVEGKTVVIRSSIKNNGEYAPVNSFAQPKGHDTLPILKELGYSEKEIAEIIETKAAYTYEV
ncbi:CoA transferase [Flavobacterium sp.]|uniref:CaiB/BaiF CoA transferase family protein n=1 Tax=Flavobacterium sp. TaxID=239 RepID=UPI0025DEF434|nr:CoA transferase [Flavobacterium sp.]